MKSSQTRVAYEYIQRPCHYITGLLATRRGPAGSAALGSTAVGSRTWRLRRETRGGAVAVARPPGGTRFNVLLYSTGVCVCVRFSLVLRGKMVEKESTREREVEEKEKHGE